jgi:hypothetical protein
MSNSLYFQLQTFFTSFQRVGFYPNRLFRAGLFAVELGSNFSLNFGEVSWKCYSSSFRRCQVIKCDNKLGSVERSEHVENGTVSEKAQRDTYCVSFFDGIKDILEAWFMIQLCFLLFKVYIGGYFGSWEQRRAGLENLSEGRVTRLGSILLAYSSPMVTYQPAFFIRSLLKCISSLNRRTIT